MELSGFDGKRCRVTLTFGDVFEGVCRHCGREYVFDEYGIDEEALMMAALLLQASIIESVEELGDEGPWGGYSGPWGLLEESAAADGPDIVSEVLTWEEDETAIRMMRLLREDTTGLASDPEVVAGLMELDALTGREEAREMAEALLAAAAGEGD
ncbi:MAG: hypothetical protein J5822_06380 [Eubacteriaceae bacterium]|nr:hypothetical protein [Eubacteriaceae bacterium]